MEVKEESEKVDLELNIQKTKVIAYDSITLWKINGETVETVTDFILGAPKSLQIVSAAMKLKDTFIPLNKQGLIFMALMFSNLDYSTKIAK